MNTRTFWITIFSVWTITVTVAFMFGCDSDKPKLTTLGQIGYAASMVSSDSFYVAAGCKEDKSGMRNMFWGFISKKMEKVFYEDGEAPQVKSLVMPNINLCILKPYISGLISSSEQISKLRDYYGCDKASAAEIDGLLDKVMCEN